MREISYNPLWITMIEKGISSKTQLHDMTGISRATLNHMKNGEPVNLSCLLRIANALDVGIESIVEFKEKV